MLKNSDTDLLTSLCKVPQNEIVALYELITKYIDSLSDNKLRLIYSEYHECVCFEIQSFGKEWLVIDEYWPVDIIRQKNYAQQLVTKTERLCYGIVGVFNTLRPILRKSCAEEMLSEMMSIVDRSIYSSLYPMKNIVECNSYEEIKLTLDLIGIDK